MASVFRSFRRLLKKRSSRDQELPPAPAAPESSFNLPLHILPRRSRPVLAQHIVALRHQHRDLQRQFRRLCSPISTNKARQSLLRIRRMKLKLAIDRMKSTVRPLDDDDDDNDTDNNTEKPLPPRQPARQQNKSFHANTHAKLMLNTMPMTSPVGSAVQRSLTSPSTTTTTTLQQAASAHRLRRLREWSQQHGNPPTTSHGGASSRISHYSSSNTSSKNNHPVLAGVASMNNIQENKAWVIMAALSLQEADHSRQKSVGAGNNQPATIAPSLSPQERRRDSEPPQNLIKDTALRIFGRSRATMAV